MASLSDLLGGLIHNSQATGVTTDPSQGSQSAPLSQLLGQAGPPQQVPVDTNLTGDAGARPFTHTQIVQKHGLGNILAILGDAFLASHGLQPQYLPKLQAAKDADALEGYDQDPMSAITRLGVIDPARADSMRNDLITNLYKRQLINTSAATQQKDLAELPGIAADSRQKAFTPYAQLAQAATKDSWPAVRARIISGMTRDGLSDKLADLPQDYDANGIATFAGSVVPVDKQIDNARQAAVAAEDARHHKSDEGLRAQSNSIEAENAGTSAARAGIEAGSAADRKRNIDSEIANRLFYQKHPELGRTIGGLMAAGGAGVPSGGGGPEIRYDAHGNAFVKDPKTGKPVPYKP